MKAREREQLESALRRLAGDPTAEERAVALERVVEDFVASAGSATDVVSVICSSEAFLSAFVELMQEGVLSADGWRRLVAVRAVRGQFMQAVAGNPAPDDVVVALADARRQRGWA